MELHKFQEDIIQECIYKQCGGLSLPMGSGKTIISLKLALHNRKDNEKILIVASKTLIFSWEQEIKKWYSDLKYKFLNLIDNINETDNIILTTPTTLVKFYKLYRIQNKCFFKDRENDFAPEIIYYNDIKEPLIQSNINTFYSIKFSTLIVDEAHNFLNINTSTCKSLISICADYKWLLSGTLFSEPKVENILGFLRMTDQYINYPDNLPGLVDIIKYKNFPGIKDLLVIRKENAMFVNKPQIIKEIVKYTMNKDEEKIYTIFKKLIKQLFDKLSRSVRSSEQSIRKSLNATLLSMILKMRLCLISPILPLTKIYLDNIDHTQSNEIYKNITSEFNKNKIDEYLNNNDNLVSTRIKCLFKKINKHPNERIIIFSSFRLVLNYIISLTKFNRNIYVLSSTDTIKKREQIITDYSNDPSGLLFLTYQLGAEGLNLQCASVIMIMDIWWNDSKSKQAIARVYRYGQTKDIHVYTFTSNTYIEYAMYEKHNDKRNLVDELMTGEITTSIKKISLEKIVNLLTSDDINYDIIKLSF